MRNLVPRSRLFQDLFDDRRDLDRVFGRVSSGETFDKAPPSATSAGSLPASPISTKTPRPTLVECHSLASIPESSGFASGEKRSRSAVSARRSAAKRMSFFICFICEETTDGSFERTFTRPEGVDTASWS